MKRISSAVVAVSLFGMVSTMPVHAIAQSRNSDSKTRNESRSESSKCERLTSGTFRNSLGGKRDNVSLALMRRLEKLANRRMQSDSSLINIRESSDSKRAEHYAKLLEAATDENHKAAVAVFQQAVEKAVADRRAGLDTARQAYRDGVDALIGDQKVVYEQALLDLQSATDAAIQTAKTACENGNDYNTVKDTLKSELSAARDTFRAAIASREDLKTKLEELRNARKEAFLQVKADFKTALEEAKAVFKAAVGETQSSDDDDQSNSESDNISESTN